MKGNARAEAGATLSGRARSLVRHIGCRNDWISLVRGDWRCIFSHCLRLWAEGSAQSVRTYFLYLYLWFCVPVKILFFFLALFVSTVEIRHHHIRYRVTTFEVSATAISAEHGSSDVTQRRFSLRPW